MTLTAAYASLRNPIGTQPIAWSNDDFHELGGDTSLEQCLTEMRTAGYVGTELGHKFPRTADALRRTLDAHALRLISGWHSSYLALRPWSDEEAAFRSHLTLLKACGATVAIVAECSHRVYARAEEPLDFSAERPGLIPTLRRRVYNGLERLAQLSAAEGVTLVYHHHMGTLVQTREELDELLDATPSLQLLYDTGHLAFAGIDPLAVLRDCRARIAHVHLKNVRPAVVAQAQAERWSFAQAVRAGVYTVPGDPEGGVDFPAVFAELAAERYRGWLVVEAEQDPARAPALRYAAMARAYLRQTLGL